MATNETQDQARSHECGQTTRIIFQSVANALRDRAETWLSADKSHDVDQPQIRLQRYFGAFCDISSDLERYNFANALSWLGTFQKPVAAQVHTQMDLLEKALKGMSIVWDPDLDPATLDPLARRLSDLSRFLGEVAENVYVPQRRAGTPTVADEVPLSVSPAASVDPKRPMRNQVFISYSHNDHRWHDDLLTHLKPHLRGGSVTAWSDQQIATGSKWVLAIQEALARTSVAVLLVTPDFLASDFIHEHELSPILKEAERGGVRIVWIPLRASAFDKTSLKDYQAVVDPARPLARMKATTRDEAWVKICQEIEETVKQQQAISDK